MGELSDFPFDIGPERKEKPQPVACFGGGDETWIRRGRTSHLLPWHLTSQISEF